jgi:hypothetical protein
MRRDSSYIFLTVKRTVKLLTFRLCVLNVLLVNVISIFKKFDRDFKCHERKKRQRRQLQML